MEKYNLKLVLETHGKEHGKGSVLADICRRVNSERVKVNYDTANVVFYGDVDPCDDLADCIEDVAYVHLKDKGGEKDVWDFPAVGKGWINFPKFFKQLEDAGNHSAYRRVMDAVVNFDVGNATLAAVLDELSAEE